jgi:hypothetical protein
MKFQYRVIVVVLLAVFLSLFAGILTSNPGDETFLENIAVNFQKSLVLTETAEPTAVIDSQMIDSGTVEPIATEILDLKAVSTKSTEVASSPLPETPSPKSRGYMTTPEELTIIAEKAASNIEPYKSAVDDLMEYVGSPDYWPYGTISGEQNCIETLEPQFIGEGAPLIFAKAIAFHLTGNSAYAEDARIHLLDLVDTYGFGGEVYSGGNQCILNLSWYIPNWIIAADLIEPYPNWSKTDKLQFQTWLAQEVYKKTAWSSRERKNNWGSAGSAASGMIADYLWDTSLKLQGATPHKAYLEHKKNQLDRLNTKKKFDSSCHKWGIQSYGGIPDELDRGSSGCNAQWIDEQDGSWNYTMTFLQGAVFHAEFLLRRGDSSLFDNMAKDGSGSILKAIHFVIANPINPNKSTDWRESTKQTLEITYRYYRDLPTAIQLRIGTNDRFIGGKSNPMIHFGTLTHAFATNEDPGLPPTVPPP